MRWLALIFVGFVVLLAPQLADPATSPLVRVSPPHGGYSVLLPRSWRFADASYPSDHATHLWFDPRNALRKMVVVASGCVGCASKNADGRTPNPGAVVPEGAHIRRINPYTVAFNTTLGSDLYNPYPESGVVVVTHENGGITGWVRVELWLPQRDHSLTNRIISSFRLTG